MVSWSHTIKNQQTSSMSKRHKQSKSELFSVENLHKETDEITQEAVGAKILNDMNSIDLRGLCHLSMDIILFILIVKFGLAVCAMYLLLINVRHEVFALL